MVSMWGSNKNKTTDDDNTEEIQPSDESSSNPPRTNSRRPPTERTRLLHDNPPPRADGYLDPDDPAVSPYNLWSVRFLRYIAVLFAIITFIWWVLLLVSIFVTPPGLNTRGSGYTDFAYTTLTFGNLLVCLLFFTGPSTAVRVVTGIVAGLLVVDVILIAAVEKIRHEEGWVGIASVLWAFLIAMFCVFVDRVVAWGKKEEETRLTGRPETRRTLTEWLSVLAETSIVVVFIVIIVFMTGTLILRALDAGVAYDGERYAVSGEKYSVHLQCIGNVTTNPETGKRDPTVILESGEEPSEYQFEHFLYSAYQNGTIPRYCYWDRPGYAWSDNAPSPHSAGMSSDALSEALALAGEQGPWIAMSAGYGSIVSRIFVSRNVHDVAGIIMIDPLHEDLLYKVGNALRGFELWGYGIISPLGIQRILGAIFEGRTKQDRVYGRSVWQTGKFLKAKLQESLVAEGLSKNEVVAANNIISDETPLVVVSSGIAVRRDNDWARKQRELANLTKNLVAFDVVNKAPHAVWHTLEGRQIIEKRLGELLEAARKQ